MQKKILKYFAEYKKKHIFATRFENEIFGTNNQFIERNVRQAAY